MIINLDGLRIRNNGGHLETSTDGTTWIRPGFGYGAKIAANSSQSFSSSSLAQVTLATSIFDIGGFVSGAHANSLTVPSGLDGLYMITGKIKYAGNATGQRTTVIIKNGNINTDNLGGTIPNIGASDAPEAIAAGHFVLAAGDYVGLYAYQDSGGSLSTSYASVRDIWLSMHYVGPTA